MPEPGYTDIVSQNKRYWESLAPHRLGEPVAFFQEGGSALTEDEVAAIGDVRGRRVLQLACSVGDEALTFAQCGAEVTAVDIVASHRRPAGRRRRPSGWTCRSSRTT